MFIFGIHDLQYFCPDLISDFMYCASHHIEYSITATLVDGHAWAGFSNISAIAYLKKI